MTDAELVAGAVDGNAEAFRQLVLRYQEVAQRAAYVVTGGLEVEEIVQDAFVKAYATLHRLRVGESFRPWLIAIVANEARNRLRSRDRARDLVARLGHIPPVWAPSTEDMAVVAAERRRVLGAVNALSAEDRLVVSYRYFLDMSEAEMAQALSCAPGTVKSRLHRALLRLRTQLLAEQEVG